VFKIIAIMAIAAAIIIFVRRQVLVSQDRKRQEERQLRQEVERQEWQEMIGKKPSESIAPPADQDN
jgi:predicted nucleic acid-binding Zn ribbon protein